ncbi:putative transcriptional regulator [Klebsiella pneumoniae]|uniref:Putative transcriptional regulator n=1 Tax=Klebsiella pneumoniae TaxID=573 RepID=A0A2X3D1H8_KLEPN|nr:putative transcriptional regulator [Klebsiella pneumoniae]
MDSITTLIVEDEPMLAEILVDNIKQFPQFDVIGIADKLESARKQLRLYQPQLILLDNFFTRRQRYRSDPPCSQYTLQGKDYLYYCG